MKSYLHILFWLATLVVLTLVFSSYYNSISEAFYFVAMLMPVVVGTNYFFNGILVPRYFFRGRYLKFALYSFYMLIISLYLEMVVIMLSFILLAAYSYDNMSPVSSDVFVLTITLYFVVFLFSFIRFLRKRQSDLQSLEKLREEKKKLMEESITVRSERKMKPILLKDITYIESLADYVKIHQATGKSIITKEPISKLHQKLPADRFLRAHRSFVVNRDHISNFNREEIFIGETIIPISRTYRQTTWSALNT